MGELTTTSYLILGMLANRDWSAYGIAEQIGRGVTEIWPRANRGLYNAPKRLVERGYATAKREHTGKRSRTVYSITPEGLAALQQWLSETSKPSALEFEGMVRVILADRGTIEDLRENLRMMATQAAEGRDLFVGLAQKMVDHPHMIHIERLHVLALANRFMIQHFCNISEWAVWALEEIESWDDTVEVTPDIHAASLAMAEASIQLAIASAERIGPIADRFGVSPSR